jgi:hypothetical protein
MSLPMVVGNLIHIPIEMSTIYLKIPLLLKLWCFTPLLLSINVKGRIECRTNNTTTTTTIIIIEISNFVSAL